MLLFIPNKDITEQFGTDMYVTVTNYKRRAKDQLNLDLFFNAIIEASTVLYNNMKFCNMVLI